MLKPPLLLPEQGLSGLDINSFTSIRDLERPLDVVFIEAQLVDHPVKRAINGVLHLGTEGRWCQCQVEWGAARERN